LESFYKECKQLEDAKTTKDWEYLYKKYKFKSKEAARSKWKNYRKKNGLLPRVENVKSKEIENKLTILELKEIDLKKEKIKVRDQKREFDNLIRQMARFEYIKEFIEEVANNISKEKFINWKKPNYKPSKKEGVLLISDWHSELTVDNFLNKFNQKEFKRRVDRLVAKTIEYGKFHNIKTLHLVNLNDLLSGNIHINARIMNNEDIITQTMYICEILGEMLYEFANEFDSICYYDVLDNHSRVTADKNESIPKESFARFIPFYLKQRVKEMDNIKIFDNVLDDDISVFSVCGYNCFAVHGHKDNVSNVVQNLSLMIKEFPDYVFMSHWHHSIEDEIHSVEVIVNPSLLGVDTYSKDLRKTSKPAQKLLIFTPDDGRECTYSIRLDR